MIDFHWISYLNKVKKVLVKTVGKSVENADVQETSLFFKIYI